MTGYRVFPFVGLVSAGGPWTPQETEVAQVLELSLTDLVSGHAMKRLVRRGVPFRTPTYTVDGHLVWGATARIVQSLLERSPRTAVLAEAAGSAGGAPMLY